MRMLNYYKKPSIHIDLSSGTIPSEVAAWIKNYSIINIAGNSESTYQGIEKIVTDFLIEVFTLLGFKILIDSNE